MRQLGSSERQRASTDGRDTWEGFLEEAGLQLVRLAWPGAGGKHSSWEEGPACFTDVVSDLVAGFGWLAHHPTAPLLS